MSRPLDIGEASVVTWSDAGGDVPPGSEPVLQVQERFLQEPPRDEGGQRGQETDSANIRSQSHEAPQRVGPVHDLCQVMGSDPVDRIMEDINGIAVPAEEL